MSRAFAIVLALAAFGCAGRGEDNGACGWLFTPSTFVDAGLACTFEPAGQVCNPSTGRCESVCQPTEFILTCRTVVSGIAVAERAFQDSTSSSNPPDNCNPVQMPLQGARWEAVYCCPCERQL